MKFQKHLLFLLLMLFLLKIVNANALDFIVHIGGGSGSTGRGPTIILEGGELPPAYYNYNNEAERRAREARIAEEQRREENRVRAINEEIDRKNELALAEVRRIKGEAAARAAGLERETTKIKAEAEKKEKYDKEYYVFQTSIRKLYYDELATARDYEIKAIEYLENNPHLPNIDFRTALVGSADLLIASADEAFVDNQIEHARELLDLSKKCLDSVFDFVPGISISKDIISLSIGKNPITGEVLTDLDKTLLVGSIFAPAVIAGSAKGILKAASVLARIAKNATSDFRRVNAQALLDLIKATDKFIHDSLGSPESMRTMLQEVGAVTDKITESAAKLFKKTPAREELTDLFDIAKANGNKFDDLSGFVSGKLTRYGPINHGPLHDIVEGTGKVANTFRSGSYFENTLEQPLQLYRVYSDDGRMLSKYWSRTKPNGPTQAMLDSALDPAWGNQATKWVEVTVPANEKIFEGIVGEVGLQRFKPPVEVGKILGGGSQVYIDTKIPQSWITGGGKF